MRVLVCGGRDWENESTLGYCLDRIADLYGIDAVIEGGARGADRLAAEWATRRGIAVEEYPADWDLHGKAAGPIRNRQMLREGKPDFVVAFPTEQSRGTRDMIRASEEAGLAVWVFPRDDAKLDQLISGAYV